MTSFFTQLADALGRGPVVLVSVVHARGSTPRLAGARQFLRADGSTVGTVGGGVMEARALDLARQSLGDGEFREWEADLFGDPETIRDGVCGGRMKLWVLRLDGPSAARVARCCAERLAVGRGVGLETARGGIQLSETRSREEGLDSASGIFFEWLVPAPRLLVGGAGHIGEELTWLSARLGFDVILFDDRAEVLEAMELPACVRRDHDVEESVRALKGWEGPRFAALVTRGFPQDVALLKSLSGNSGSAWLDYLGILGSRKRIATVMRTCQEAGLTPFSAETLRAPVGLEIGAESPAEIAVSIAAEMIQVLRRNSARSLPGQEMPENQHLARVEGAEDCAPL